MKKYFSRIKSALSRTRENFLSLFENEQLTWEEIEEALIEADVGPEVTELILSKIRNSLWEGAGRFQILKALKREILNIVKSQSLEEFLKGFPAILLMTGVNGTGKTTTAAKLAWYFKNEGKKPLLCAADTYRAAASQQLKILAEKAGVDFFKSEAKDPAAVAFDAAKEGLKRKYDVIIIDTAGRLHSREDLMREAVKIKNSVIKASELRPHTLLVLDGTTGQNAIFQAQEFHSKVGVDALVITKLDGTAKGGALLPISVKVPLPVLFIGTGENLEDLVPFEAESFVEALLET